MRTHQTTAARAFFRRLLAPASALVLLALGGCVYGPAPYYGGYAAPGYAYVPPPVVVGGGGYYGGYGGYRPYGRGWGHPHYRGW
jgi:hypothetical protein